MTDNESIAKTRTYKYLFLPILHFYHSDSVIKAFEAMSIDNVYIADKDERFKPIDCMFHILVQNNEDFYVHLDTVKTSNFYKGHYSLDKEHNVILFKGFSGKSTKHFLASEYSKMFDEGSFLEVIKKPLATKYMFEYRVLSNDTTLREEIATKLNTNVELIQELDSKIVIEDELL